MARERKSKSSEELGQTATTEQRILHAFLEMAFQSGVANVTLQKLSDQSKISFGTIRNYFNVQKRSIEVEAIRYVTSLAYSFIDARMMKKRASGKFHPIHAYLETMFEWYSEHPEQASYLVYYYYLCMSQFQHDLPGTKFFETAWLRLEGLLHEAIGLGLYKKPKNALSTARDLHLSAMGAFVYHGNIQSNPEKAKMFLNDSKKTMDALVLAHSF